MTTTTCEHLNVRYRRRDYVGDGYTQVCVCKDCGTVCSSVKRCNCGGRFITDSSGLVDTCERCGYGRA